MNSPENKSSTTKEENDDEELRGKKKNTTGKPKHRARVNKLNLKCQYKNCDKSFATLYHFNRHMKTHEEGKVTPYDCPICSERFFKSEMVLEHSMFVHGNANPYKCEYCDKCFKRVEYLRSHILIHTGEYPWKCGVCLKGFERKKKLDMHVAVHEKERAFVCDECGQGFNYRSVLINHLRIHKGEYVRICSYCGQGFRHTLHYKEHMERHEGKYVRYPCEYCGKIYSTKTYLNTHMRTRHDSNAERIRSRSYNRVEKVDDIENYQHVQIVKNKSKNREGKRRNWEDVSFRSEQNEPEIEITENERDEGSDSEEMNHSRNDVDNFVNDDVDDNDEEDNDDDHHEGSVDEDNRGYSDDDFMAAVPEVELGEESLVKLDISENRSSGEVDDSLKVAQSTRSVKNSTEDSLECSYCGKVCSSSAYLKVHVRIHTNEYPITCAICSKGFNCKGHLIRHMLLHSKERPFVCEICGKDFNVKSTWKSHVQQHSGQFKYQCEYCGRNFHNSRHFKDHVAERHLGRVHRNFVCEHCGQSYRKKLLLQRHLDRHAGVGKTFECLVCGVKFSFYSDFRKHKKTHLKCDACHKTFSKLATYKKHVRMNLCQKELVCPFCHRRFDHSGNFKKHLKTHEYGRSNKQTFSLSSCNICGKSFSRKNTLEQHMDRIHNESMNGKYECDICHKTFVSAASLKGHSKTHFARELHCPYCSRIFNHVGNYNKHVKMHESPNFASKKVNFHTCGICNTSFSRKSTLGDHYIRVHKLDDSGN